MYFITSNKGKINSLQNYLKDFGCLIEVKQKTIELPEIQADSVLDISRAKAKAAFLKLKHPLVVEDGGFCVEALNNFPGVYVRYILDTIGAEGLLQLMKNQENRNCRFVSVATFVDAEGNLTSFTREGGSGKMTREMDMTDCPHAWSDIWRIYEVIEFGKTLSALNEEELREHRLNAKESKSSLRLFAEWYSENY